MDLWVPDHKHPPDPDGSPQAPDDRPLNPQIHPNPPKNPPSDSETAILTDLNFTLDNKGRYCNIPCIGNEVLEWFKQTNKHDAQRLLTYG